MGAYGTIANGYEKHIEAHPDIDEVTRKHFESQIKILHMLDSLDGSEIDMIFDTGVFNKTILHYLRSAMENCGMDIDTINKVIVEYYKLLDEFAVEHIRDRHK